MIAVAVIAWAVLVLVTVSALASVSWLAVRSVAYVAGPRLRAAPRPGLRASAWIVFLVTAFFAGIATGHPFAVAVLLVPAVVVDHGSQRLWGTAARDEASTDGPKADPAGPLQGDRLLRDSWSQAVQLGVDAAVVGTARDRCDNLLRAHRAEPLELSMLEWAVFVQRSVPELVASCRDEVAQSEDAAPRPELLRQVAETLEQVGLEAKRRRDAGRRVAQSRFELARNHARERIVGAR